MRARRLLALLGALAFAGALGLRCAPPEPGPEAALRLPGLEHPVRVVTDRFGSPHLFAHSDLDLARVQGWIHARDRIFQMDLTRREVGGTRAELLGASALPGDIQNRTIGLRRAAARSLAILEPRERAILQAYADGVNAWLDQAEASGTLPPEYAQLEIQHVRRWQPLDSLAIGKGISASLSLDIDAGRIEQLDAYVRAGQAADPPFDGAALLLEDVQRAAPMDPASTVPDASGQRFFLAARSHPLDLRRLSQLARAARRFRRRAQRSPLLLAAMRRSERTVGSNHWGIAARYSVSGFPMLANDPHLSLDMPSTFYENHLVVDDDPVDGPMNVSGITFAGIPGVILGQNESITWGATTNPMDVTDLFADRIVRDPACPSFACIRSGGQLHPLEATPAAYLVNEPDDGIPDHLRPARFGSEIGPENFVIFTVPFRSFGPVVDVDDPGVLLGDPAVTESRALVLQFTGFHATRELRTFRKWSRAHNLDEFRDGLRDFDFGSQNWAYADAEGNLAVFTSGEMPLRADLEAGAVAGLPPFVVRDGESGQNNWVPDPSHSQGQSIPFAILPEEEMPQVVNPSRGFFVNANNDPAGTTLDNDPLNQLRRGKPGAIYYLNPSYDRGLRAGRITRLIRSRLAAGEKLSARDLRAFQANTQQLDAELLLPHLVEAFLRAGRPDAPPELRAFHEDREVAAALERLAAWDFSTPTGIPEGYDASDRDGRRLPVRPEERRKAVAATVYNVWRAKAIRGIVDRRLAELGVPGVGSGDALKALHHLLQQQPYTGVGASGVDFIPLPVGLPPADRRDVALLGALRDALDALASPDFARAFGGSRHLEDYLWGRLHRITFDHPLGGSFSVPPSGGFEDLAPGLPGLARDGGYDVVNASGFSARADRDSSFRFGGGPVRRYTGVAGAGAFPGARVLGTNVIPGGSSGIPGDPLTTRQLGLWLTADAHPVEMFEDAARRDALAIELFTGP